MNFQPFNPNGEMRVYVRSLPHWRQPGATYFVAFRQGDSIPERVLAESTACQQANGIEPARARELVTAIFPPRPR